MRWVLRSAATDPKIGEWITYAARHGVSPQVYAPLIARAIATPMQEQKKDQGEEAPAKQE
jgi:hypothetical protein